MSTFADTSIRTWLINLDQHRAAIPCKHSPRAADMIDLETSDQLIKSDIACLIAILADALACDEDLNESRDELRNVVEKLAYLVVDEG